jgi:DNA polymerase III epsilon subunit-like protein
MPNQPSDYKSFINMLSEGNYFVVDTETTGLKHPAEIVDIAIVKYNGSLIFESLVKPVRPIPPEAEAIHGISNDMVKDARTWKELRPILDEILSNQTIITYNATFDRHMFHLSDEASGLDQTDWEGVCNWYCAMQAFAERFGQYDDYFGSFRWKKLSEAIDFYSCDLLSAHRAASDALMTFDVIKCMYAENVFSDDVFKLNPGSYFGRQRKDDQGN